MEYIAQTSIDDLHRPMVFWMTGTYQAHMTYHMSPQFLPQCEIHDSH